MVRLTHDGKRYSIEGHRGEAGSLRIDEDGWGGAADSSGLRIHLTPALHWSKRGLFEARPARLFRGRHGLRRGQTFRDLRERFGPPRLSLLPIGADKPLHAVDPARFMAPGAGETVAVD